MMNNLVATSIGSDLGCIEEIKYGSSPSSPHLGVFRRTNSAGLVLTKEAYVSEEIKSDRQTSDLRHGVRRVVGEILTEVLVPSYTDQLAALMGNHWEIIEGGNIGDVTVHSLENDGHLAQFSGWPNLVSSGVSAGMRVILSGFFDLENNGLATVVSISPTNNLKLIKDLTPSSSPFVEVTSDNGATLVVLGGVIRIGGSYRSFTFEKAYSDIQKYQKYTGVMINSLKVDMTAARLSKFSWGVIGKDTTTLTNASIDSSAKGVQTYTEVEWGTLSFDGQHTLTASIGGFLADIDVGDVLVFSSLTLLGPGYLDDMVDKTFVVNKVVSNTQLIFFELVDDGDATPFIVTVSHSPDYMKPDSGIPLSSITGALYMRKNNTSVQLASVLDITFNIDNNISGEGVVGSDLVPFNVFGLRQTVTGTLSVLFNDEYAYNVFEKEEEALLMARLDGDQGQFIQFTFPRCKFYSGNIGDSISEGLPVGLGFRALRPNLDDTTLGDFSKSTSMLIQSYPIIECFYLTEDGFVLTMEDGQELLTEDCPYTPFYREGSIYSGTKNILSTWQTEKQASGVNALRIKDGTQLVNIGWGDTEEEAAITQTTVLISEVSIFRIYGVYIGWQGPVPGTVLIEQSVIR